MSEAKEPETQTPAEIAKKYGISSRQWFETLEHVCSLDSPPTVLKEPLFCYYSLRKGNDAYLAKDYNEAIKHYSESINLEPESAVYYSNRRWIINLEDNLEDSSRML